MDPTIQRSFGGGELAPAMHARADQVKYTTGLRTCRNFFVRKEGGVSNRAGLRYIATCKDNTDKHHLFRFDGAGEGESILIEAGNGYLRFYKNGARILVVAPAAWSAVVNYVQGDIVQSGGVFYYAIAPSLNQAPPNAAFWYAMPAGGILEIPHPFLTHAFNWVQSGNVITLTHADIHPQELVFGGLTTWVLRPITTQPSIAAPTGLAGVAGAAGLRSFSYLVTAAAAETYEESNPSTPTLIAAAAEPTAAAPNTLSWTAVPGAAEYYIYLDPFGNNTFGFIGTATGQVIFSDPGFIPDFAVTPPIPRVLFNAGNDFPDAAGFFQQRRFMAHTNNAAEGIFGSRVGFHNNFGISSPLQDDDAITFRIVGNQQNPVRWLLGLKALIVGTAAGIWVVGEPKQALTPNNIPTDQQTYVGTHDKKPAAIGNSILYVQARGSIVNEVRFEQQVEGLAGRDMTVFAAHLFEGFTLNRIDYQHTPLACLWAPRGDGTLLGLTYIPEHDLWGWHRHDTGADGQFEDVCVVPESGADVTYFIIKRTIGGQTVRYIEKLESRAISVDADGLPTNFDVEAFFVDSGLTYNGSPATTITGLTHLIGQVVAVLADGAVIFNGDPTSASAATYTVSALGSITLPAPAEVVHVGLPIRYGDVETLDLDVAGATVRPKRKRVGEVALLIDKSSRVFFVGPDVTQLRQFDMQPFDAVGDVFTGQVTIPITADYNDYGRVFIRQKDPLPLTILGVIPNLDLGG